MVSRRASILALALVVSSAELRADAPVVGARDLTDLSLEQLANVVVSTVSGRAEPLSRALGSVYVISSEDIRRSGATSLPEALRLAPNLEVAHTSVDGWAITARGFNGTLANKLLVLIDGRSVYTPTFSGVFWDAQDVLLEDIDRIEVISGPGGVLWGANAVDGVINILTRKSSETQRTLISAEGGNNEARLEARYGGASGRYRVYAQASRMDDSTLPSGAASFDGRDRLQAGFRSDLSKGAQSCTLQGDWYDAENNREPTSDELRGANLLGRWNRDLGEGASVRVQAYYDRTSRTQQDLDTFDVELAHALRAHGASTLLWGGNFRRTHDHIDNTGALAILPADKTLTSGALYLQDVIALGDEVDATIGARLDRNTYTGVETLPSARLGWRPSEIHLFWAAASRAVRTPSRFDRELFLPGAPPFLLAGGPSFESEISYVYELGYRGQPAERFSWSATAFYHDLRHQRSIAPGPAGATVENDREGHATGIETWGAYRINDRWRLWAGYNYLEKDLRVRAGAVDLQPESSTGSDPGSWWTLRSAVDIGRSVELDVMLRRYGRLDNIDVPAYTAVDARLAWVASRHLELSLLARSVADPDHVEWAPGSAWDREYVGKALIRF